MTDQINEGGVEEHWDSYIASYEEGKPGLTTLRMDLIETAPVADYPMVLVTGFTFKSGREDGFPEEENLQAVHDDSDKLIAFVEQKFDCLHVASFMYDCQRMEYFYLRSGINVEAGIQQFYAEQLSAYENHTNVDEDKDWSLYREFLFPTDEILHYMYDQKVVMHLEEEGDDMTTPRRVDHWILFDKENDAERFAKEAEKQGFEVEGVSETEHEDTALQLQVFREDKIDLDDIFPVTAGLRDLAQKFEGDYDGWETFVVSKK